MAINYAQRVKTYTSAASNEINPQFNSKVQILKNTLAQNKLALTQQKTGVNRNYDTEVTNQNMTNKNAVQSFNNNITARGLGRSSIQATGSAEMGLINNRQVGAINSRRTGDLNDIDAKVTMETNNFNNTVGTMTADKNATIYARANEMGAENEALDYRDRRDRINDAYRNSTKSNGGGGTNAQNIYSSDIPTAYAASELKKNINNAYQVSVQQGTDKAFLSNYKTDIINSLGKSSYNSMFNSSAKISESTRSGNVVYTANTASYNKARQKNVILNNRKPAN